MSDEVKRVILYDGDTVTAHVTLTSVCIQPASINQCLIMGDTSKADVADRLFCFPARDVESDAEAECVAAWYFAELDFYFASKREDTK